MSQDYRSYAKTMAEIPSNLAEMAKAVGMLDIPLMMQGQGIG